jgi:cellobiose-specific phosphotransferase system component IIC
MSINTLPRALGASSRTLEKADQASLIIMAIFAVAFIAYLLASRLGDDL